MATLSRTRVKILMVLLALILLLLRQTSLSIRKQGPYTDLLQSTIIDLVTSVRDREISG